MLRILIGPQQVSFDEEADLWVNGDPDILIMLNMAMGQAPLPGEDPDRQATVLSLAQNLFPGEITVVEHDEKPRAFPNLVY